MAEIAPAFFSVYLHRTGAVLRALTAGLSAEQAREWRDGGDGWNTLEVIAHLRDYEYIFVEWAELMRNQECPTLPLYDQDELARERRYSDADLPTVLVEWEQARAASIAYYDALPAAAYARPGINQLRGAWSVGHGLALQVLHDYTHFEQLAKIRAGGHG